MNPIAGDAGGTVQRFFPGETRLRRNRKPGKFRIVLVLPHAGPALQPT